MRKSRYIYQNKLDKACFQYDVAYGDFEDLNRKTVSDKAIVINNLILLKIMYERGLTLMVLIFFDKKTSGRTVKHKIISNKELAQELHRPIIRKFEKRKVHSSFIDNIWSVDLADMQLISKFNIRLRFLLCVIDIYSRYA